MIVGKRVAGVLFNSLNPRIKPFSKTDSDYVKWRKMGILQISNPNSEYDFILSQTNS